MKKFYTIISALILSAMTLTVNASALDAEKAQYKALTESVMQAVVSGNVSDMSGLEAKLNQATDIGVKMAGQVARQDTAGKPLLDFVSSNVETIKGLGLDAIESQWHHGKGFPASTKHDSFDHYSAVIGAKDAIVHPLTALVALKEYSKTQDSEYLEVAQAELEEIIGQLQYIK